MLNDLTVQSPAVARFLDHEAREWEVREIRKPILSDRRGFFRQPEFADGWLLFMCGGERRRLAPLPPGWQHANERQLQQWCSDAVTVKERITE